MWFCLLELCGVIFSSQEATQEVALEKRRPSWSRNPSPSRCKSVYLGLNLSISLCKSIFISVSLSNLVSFSNRLSLSFSLKPTQSFSLSNRQVFPFPQIYSVRDLGVHRVLWFRFQVRRMTSFP